MEDIRLYDFKKSEKFSIESERYLVKIVEEFCKIFNMQINYEVKHETMKLGVYKSVQSTYDEFSEDVKNDTVIIEYNIDPIVENLTVFIDKWVVLSVVDILLGGSGKVKDINREPTNIDLELMKCLFENLFKRVGKGYQYDSIEIVKIYTNTLEYQKVANNRRVFGSLINVNFENDMIGYIRVCIPYESIEPVIGDLASIDIKTIEKAEDSTSDKFSNRVFGLIEDVDMDICANLGTANIKINDLINLESGDIILLNQKISDDIIVTVGESKMYRAKPGFIGVKKGIEIKDIINKE